MKKLFLVTLILSFCLLTSCSNKKCKEPIPASKVIILCEGRIDETGAYIQKFVLDSDTFLTTYYRGATTIKLNKQ